MKDKVELLVLYSFGTQGNQLGFSYLEGFVLFLAEIHILFYSCKYDLANM